jgi:hypothetical protein
MMFEVLVLCILAIAATMRMFHLEEICDEQAATIEEQNMMIMNMAIELQSLGSPNVKVLNAPKEEVQTNQS